MILHTLLLAAICGDVPFFGAGIAYVKQQNAPRKQASVGHCSAQKAPFSIAAAAENDECNNDDPAAAVVATEKSTDTVVIHNRSSL
jgi:hypothetical protein